MSANQPILQEIASIMLAKIKKTVGICNFLHHLLGISRVWRLSQMFPDDTNYGINIW